MKFHSAVIDLQDYGGNGGFLTSNNHVFFQADADGLCTVLGDALPREGGVPTTPGREGSVPAPPRAEAPPPIFIDKSIFEQAGWVINREDITVKNV